MSNIDKRALREAAEKATPGPWYVHDKPCEDGNYGIDTSDKEFLAEAVVWWGFARQSIWRDEDAKFIAASNPTTVLALLDELEAKDKRIAELEVLAFNPALLDVISERQRQRAVEG
ncbi:ead/Ea22-like family protein, partial [Enterobacter asburiae]|uniref:ead/Ea22-like family protein n=1 Tax=Enterobacter asburiae TaxID=61645 RepID=UPI003076606F